VRLQEPVNVEHMLLALVVSYIVAEIFIVMVIIILFGFEFMMQRKYLSSSSMVYSASLPAQICNGPIHKFVSLTTFFFFWFQFMGVAIKKQNTQV
jgi:hypothetical protein